MLENERIETPDGDFLDITWMPETDPARPLVLVLHGLEGHTRKGYMVQTYRALADRGMRAVGLNFRGCSGEMNRKPRFYHSGETEDIGFVFDLLRERFPTRPLMAIGFSLGGNILLKYLGERGAKNTATFSAAVAISVPYDLSAGAKALERRGMARVYAGYFLRSLLAKVRSKKEILAKILDLDTVLASTTIRDFDEAATSKLHGFAGAEDYYRKSSSNRFIQAVGSRWHRRSSCYPITTSGNLIRLIGTNSSNCSRRCRPISQRWHCSQSTLAAVMPKSADCDGIGK
jgi:hypothetical protein